MTWVLSIFAVTTQFSEHIFLDIIPTTIGKYLFAKTSLGIGQAWEIAEVRGCDWRVFESVCDVCCCFFLLL